MTRRHFKAIAQAIRDTKLSKRARRELVIGLCLELSAFNPRFNWERFTEACGL